MHIVSDSDVVSEAGGVRTPGAIGVIDGPADRAASHTAPMKLNEATTLRQTPTKRTTTGKDDHRTARRLLEGARERAWPLAPALAKAAKEKLGGK